MQALMRMLFCLVVDTQGKGCARAYRLQLLSGMGSLLFAVFAISFFIHDYKRIIQSISLPPAAIWVRWVPQLIGGGT